MMIRKLCRRAAGMFFAATLFLTFSSVRAAIPPAENLLPSDTLFVFTVPDFAALRADARQSPQWQFWNDPTMELFHNKFVSKMNDAIIGPLETDLGVKWADFEDLPQGQLTFAVTQNGWNGGGDKSPGIILLLDAKGKSEQLKTNLAALQKKWTDDGKTIRTQTIRGVPFSVVMISSNDIPPSVTNIFPARPQVQELGRTPPPERPHELLVGQFDSLLIVGNATDVVDPIVAHLTGSEMPALSDGPAFAADKLARFGDSPLYYGWLDAKAFFGILASIQPPAPNPEAPTVMPQVPWNKVIAALGLTAVNSVSIVYRDTQEGAQLNFFIAEPASARQGIFKMLALEHETAIPPAFVPADVTKFVRCRVDGQQAWQTLQDILDNVSPSVKVGVDAAIDMANVNAQQKEPGFDIRKNLFENLGDDFIRYQKPPDGTGDANGAPSLFLFSVQNGDRAVASITTLMSMLPTEQKAPPPRNFQGFKIYSIPLSRGGMPGMAGTPTPQNFLYCATSDGYVALTTDISMMEEFLRSAANRPKPLSGLPGLVDAAQHVGGGGNGMFGYENQREMLRPVFKTLQAETSGDPAATGVMPLLPKQFRDWMDFSLLPDYDSVSKYFYFSVYAGSATVDGISIKTFAPRPPGLD